jgi:hypothetical protein
MQHFLCTDYPAWCLVPCIRRKTLLQFIAEIKAEEMLAHKNMSQSFINEEICMS